MKTGYIEGYYGKQLSFKEREFLINQMGSLGMSHYLYSPKEDAKHRMSWREDYDQEFIDRFAGLIQCADKNHIEIIFGISPGNDFDFHSDYPILLSKFKRFIDLGLSSCCLLLDDLFKENSGKTHQEILNHLARDLNSIKLYAVPQVYSDQVSQEKNIFANKYLHDFLGGLDTSIALFFTGKKVVSKDYPTEYLKELKKLIHNRELIIWDNFYANDYCVPKIQFSEFCTIDSEQRNHLDGVLINATGSLLLDQIYLELFSAGVLNYKNRKDILASRNLPKAFYEIQHLFEFEIKSCNPTSDLENLGYLLWQWNDPLKQEMYTYLHQLKQLLQEMLHGELQKDTLLKRFNILRGDSNER